MNTPKIRFKGFKDDWEQRKLGEMVSLRGRIGFRGYTQNDLVGEGDGAITFSPADIDNDGNVSLEGNKYLTWEKYEESPEIKVQIGDILFTKTASIGKVGYVRELKEKATINPQFALLTPNEKANGYFTFLSVRNNVFMKQVRSITGGSSVPTMSQEKLKELTFMTPSLEEQKKIGEYFEKLDYLITLHQRKCDETKQLKKFMLQKMFPKNGEKNPEIRFEGFTDDWEQRKFSELYAKSSEKNDGSIGMDKNITVATMQFKEDVKVSTAEYLKTYYTFNFGDIAFEGHQSKEFRYGRFVENDIGNGIVSHIFAVFRPIREYDLHFWKYAINNEALMQRILSRSTKASTMMHDLVTNDFLNETFLVPSLDEQRRIGAFLDTLDNLITLHQRKCEKLKELKKYMLQNMFV